MTVNFSLGGTAGFDTDFFAVGTTKVSATAGRVSFAPGAATATLTIDPSNDPAGEGDETIALTLTVGSGYHIATVGAVTATILNDDTSTPPAFFQFTDPHPSPGNQFGASVVPLSTGNVVITAPFDDFGGTDAGAVYLFNGATGALISELHGSHADDNIGRNFGRNAVVALSNGHFVVTSLYWDLDAGHANVGAVTFGNGLTGVSGIISSANSLVGSHLGDSIGRDGVTVLNNGNYVVSSSFWDLDDDQTNVGAVTFGDGTTGISGFVSSANSLVGSKTGNEVGAQGVVVLSNGNYVVASPIWDLDLAHSNVGAVTFGNGVTGVRGTVSSANSLIGRTANDHIGVNGGILALSNGNYVVSSPYWDADGTHTDVGAVTFGNGTGGLTGIVSSANSLVGATSGDQLGIGGAVALSNGNYVVITPGWDLDGTHLDVGAVTYGHGTTAITGTVSSANSLIGRTTDDAVGSGGVTVLGRGRYVVISDRWDLDAAHISVGAVTLGDSTSGVVGTVSSANSLIGSTSGDQVGYGGVTVLTNGNFVVSSPLWNLDATHTAVGAVTFVNGATGLLGPVTNANSLTGSTTDDRVGETSVTALSNGNYVVSSPRWDLDAAHTDVGASTSASGATGLSGKVSSANSLIGSRAYDSVGVGGAIALSNGNYVVSSPFWGPDEDHTSVGAATFASGLTGMRGTVSVDNSLIGRTAFDEVGYVIPLGNGNYVVSSGRWDLDGAHDDVGAVTFANGTTGLTGIVSIAISLVGGTALDSVGNYGVTALDNGNYVVNSPTWDNGAVHDAGAVTFGSGTAGVQGLITAENSLLGRAAGTALQPTAVDHVNGTFLAPFRNEGSGVVRVASKTEGIAQPTVSLGVSPAAVLESSATRLVYTFTRTGSDPNLPLTVHFTTAGTAVLTSDYTASSGGAFDLQAGTITFAPQAATATLTLSPVNDADFEVDETVVLTVAGGSGYHVAPAAAATGTILNDDVRPTISIAAAGVAEGHAGTKNLDFTVSLSAASYEPVTVSFTTMDGTALASIDYTTALATLLTFAPGETSRTISVPVLGDALYEPDETFLVKLSNPGHATLGTVEAVGTIQTDDDVTLVHSVIVDARHSFTFFDRNHDRVTVRLNGLGTGALVLEGGVLDGADISAIHLVNAGKSTLSIAVTKDRATGDGLVGIGEVTALGGLASFSAPAADFIVGGLRATGVVKTITAHSLLGGVILTGGAATDKLALTFGGALGAGGDHLLISTPQSISTLKAARIGAGQIEAAALGSISVTAGSLAADVTSPGAIGTISVRGGDLSGDLVASRFGAVSVTAGSFRGLLTSLTPAVSLGATKALTSLAVTGGSLDGDVRLLGASGAITVKGGALNGHVTADSFGAVSVIGGHFAGSLISTTTAVALGTTKALTSLSVTTGSLSGLVRVEGASGAITVKGGSLSGQLRAASFGAVTVTGGDFSGSLTSFTPDSLLGPNKALASLTVTDGNLTGHVRLLGASGAITVTSKLALARGNIDGASIVASAIASLTVGRDFISSIVLAGADLGADNAFGGPGDIFAAGTIGVVKIGRNVSGVRSIIGAGFSSSNTTLKDSDDAIIGGVASIIASLTVTGVADPGSYFAAGLFKTAPKIGGTVITPAGDGRFKVG